MNRSFKPVSCLAIVMSASLFACDKPGVTEQQREMKATEQVNQAKTEADQKTQNAQASADKDVAAARATFEKNREDYRHTRRNDLTDLDKKIVDLEAKAKTSTGKAKTDLTASLAPLREQRDAFVRDMQSVDTATAANWDAAKANLDKEWDSLKAAVDKAR